MLMILQIKVKPEEFLIMCPGADTENPRRNIQIVAARNGRFMAVFLDFIVIKMGSIKFSPRLR